MLDSPMDLEPVALEEAVRLWPENGSQSADRPGGEASPYIEFDHVTFSYHKKEPNLRDVSFAVGRGETLGILGATGSGKSTVIQLLQRFYDVDDGAVRIGGRDVRTYPAGELHRLFGVVFQNDFITRDTIRENIRFGRELTEEQIREAAACAQAEPFIREKAEGFDTVVAVKGADLSGGQKQRLLISRALAAHPSILILDDSMSALDYRTDAALRGQLREHFSDTTSVIVAQRISSVLHADRILVLEEGGVAGYGTHEELMQSCEIYQDIWRIQTGVTKGQEVM